MGRGPGKSIVHEPERPRYATGTNTQARCLVDLVRGNLDITKSYKTGLTGGNWQK